MKPSRLHFETVPVSSIKQIIEASSEETAGQLSVDKVDGKSRGGWRDLAAQIQEETDSGKMIHLVQRLIDDFDREKQLQSELEKPKQ